MKLTTTLSLTLLSAISLLPSTSAWKFTWRDEDGKSSTESGKGPHSCTKIQHAEGATYSWENQGNDGVGIYLYTSSDCSGSLAGWSSADWEKESSKDLRGFKVMNEEATTTASPTGTGSHTRTATDASATATASTSGGASNSTVSASSSAVGSKTKTEASATASSSASSSNTASGSAEKTGSSSTATESSGSSSPSPTASATDGASTDESSASSLSKSSVVQIVAGLALGMTAFEWLV